MANTATPEKIPLLPVKSSAFSHYGYNPTSQELDIKWPSGQISRFYKVPPEKIDGLMEAPSMGRYLVQNIKANHQQRTMTGDCPACGDRHGWLGEVCTDCGTRNYGDPGPRKVR